MLSLNKYGSFDEKTQKLFKKPQRERFQNIFHEWSRLQYNLKLDDELDLPDTRRIRSYLINLSYPESINQVVSLPTSQNWTEILLLLNNLPRRPALSALIRRMTAATKIVDEWQPYRASAVEILDNKMKILVESMTEFTAANKWEFDNSNPSEPTIKSNDERQIVMRVQDFIGHTGYGFGEKRYTFDRLGVEDSFYIDTFTKEAITSIFSEQIARVDASIKRLADLQANGTELDFGPIRRTYMKKDLDNIITRLKSGLPWTWTPAGFGTGYVFSTKRLSYSSPASDALKTAVGRPVYYSKIDCD